MVGSVAYIGYGFVFRNGYICTHTVYVVNSLCVASLRSEALFTCRSDVVLDLRERVGILESELEQSFAGGAGGSGVKVAYHEYVTYTEKRGKLIDFCGKLVTLRKLI